MKKFLLVILLCLGLTGCSKNNVVDNSDNQEDNSEIYKCLENELGAYIMTENDTLTDISLDSISNNKDNIKYYKGVMANDDNMYIILDTNITYEWEVMKDFELFFARKFPIYQYNVINDEVYVYAHSNHNEIDFKEIANKCGRKQNNEGGRALNSKTIKSLKETNRIIVKSGDVEIGVIDDKKYVDDVVEAVTTAKIYGENFLCDGHGFDLEMYNSDGKLIDTIYYWGDTRLIPKSIHEGCSYYSQTNKNIDLREIIEKETDYLFYGFFDYSDDIDDDNLELIYEDGKYNYYLKGKESDKFIIYFSLTNKKMTLEYALNNKYISSSQLNLDSDLLLKKTKN